MTHADDAIATMPAESRLDRMASNASIVDVVLGLFPTLVALVILSIGVGLWVSGSKATNQRRTRSGRIVAILGAILLIGCGVFYFLALTWFVDY